MNPEPRPSDNCEACEHLAKQIECKWGCKNYEKCFCSCHVVGNLMNGFHHHFSAMPDGMHPYTQERLDEQLAKRNGL